MAGSSLAPPNALSVASKVDLLLVVDDSQGMDSKSERLAASIQTLVTDLARVGDVHVGVLSSSLESVGHGTVCPATPSRDGRPRLRTTGVDGAPVLGAQTGVLEYRKGEDTLDFAARVADVVRGVGTSGCGFESQLEAMYQFLVQPDPSTSVSIDKGRANFGTTVDAELLEQRRHFLRPDSALVVVMVSDEDDASLDPRSVGGQGWVFAHKDFPGSLVSRGAAQGTTAARATSVCETDPLAKDTDGEDLCTSCAIVCDSSLPSCTKIRKDPNCAASPVAGKSGPGYSGYYSPEDDLLNVRFYKMKQRFGVDPQYPVARYVSGLSLDRVPNRASEHPETPVAGSGIAKVEPYESAPTCTNPIFAESLPSAGQELCNLARGPRTAELVVFGLIGGLPTDLASDAPNWTSLVGANPEAYDLSGLDPRMVQSVAPRAGLRDPSVGEYLQSACTFSTPGPQGAVGAQPAPRLLRVAKALGDRAVIGSACDESASGYDGIIQRLSKRLAPRLVVTP